MLTETKRTDLFCEYYAKWITVYKKGAIRKVTMDKYLMTQKWLVKLVPNLRVCDMNRIAYQQLLNDYAEFHERQTTMDFHHQLKGAILDAVDEGLIERDPTRKAIIKGKPPVAKKIKYLNQFELHKVANPFIDVGFRQVKDVVDLRVFDLLNICRINNNRAEEKNSKWTPSNVSRNSMKVVWWKCGAGHSYRAKITDRTIEQKGCPQCEAEFQQALPQMLIMMYGAQNGITVKSNSDSELGMRLVAYLPELHCAVDIAGATVTEKREQSVKAHICQSNRLGYYLIKRTADTSQMAAEIKTLFIRNHIYLHTDSEKDVQVLRERFLEWKNRNACKLNGKY